MDNNNNIYHLLRFSAPDHRVYHITFCDYECLALVTDDPNRLEHWIDSCMARMSIASHPRFSLDITWYHLNFNPPDCIPRPSTIQLCFRNSCIIFYFRETIPACLTGFLANPFLEFCGIDMASKIDILYRVYGIQVSSWFDIRYKASLTQVFMNVLDVTLRELVSLAWPEQSYVKPDHILSSNWTIYPLTVDQVVYAALDCLLPYLITFQLGF